MTKLKSGTRRAGKTERTPAGGTFRRRAETGRMPVTCALGDGEMRDSNSSEEGCPTGQGSQVSLDDL
ncbi:hypothetical protein KCP74_02170 [Salmonella enterica subsp. enterica]|nr:hypothetical protein KCP74_02170 [Salmonella enterica subsp. enterica]